jgi:ankyrin repeat protein
MRAALNNHVEMLDALLKHGAELEARDGSGFTALHCTFLFRKVEAAKFFLQIGAN